jgi:hypothetical protein
LQAIYREWNRRILLLMHRNFGILFFRKSLIQADFFFEINTINRSFIVDIVLLDGNNQPLYNFSFDVPAFQELKVSNPKRNFENTKLDLLKRARRMIFVIRMGAGPALNTTSPEV